MEENNKKKSTMHIASLVLGIISIITVLFWYMSLPTGILAIIFGVKSARKTGSNIGKAGMVTGIVGISISAFIYMSIIAIIIAESVF